MARTLKYLAGTGLGGSPSHLRSSFHISAIKQPLSQSSAPLFLALSIAFFSIFFIDLAVALPRRKYPLAVGVIVLDLTTLRACAAAIAREHNARCLLRIAQMALGHDKALAHRALKQDTVLWVLAVVIFRVMGHVAAGFINQSFNWRRHT